MSDDANQPESSDAGTTPEPVVSLRQVLGIFPGADHFEILGVDVAERTPERIVAALQDQLAKLNSHADADTPEADQLRMTLHAAAADAIRDVLSTRAAEAGAGEPLSVIEPEPSPAPAPRPVAPSAPAPTRPAAVQPAAPTPMQNSPVALEAMAHMILGMHGGWNDASRRHLMLLARTHGASPEQLVRTIQGMTRRGVSPAPGRDVPRSAGTTVASAPAGVMRAPMPPGVAPAPRAAPVTRAAQVPAGAIPAPLAQPVNPVAPREIPRPSSVASDPVPHAPARATPAQPIPTTPRLTEDQAIAKVRAIAAEQPDPTRRLLVIGLVGFLVLIVILVGLLVAAIALSKAAKGRATPAVPPIPIAPIPPAPTPASTTPAVPTDPASPTRDPSTPAPTQPPKPLFDTPRPAPVATPTRDANTALRRWDDMLRDLRSLAETASADRASTADQFAKLFAEVSQAWVDTTPDGHAAAADAVVELLFRMGGDREPLLRMLDTIEHGGVLATVPTAQQVRARAFAGGVISRMARERDLPAVVRGRIDEIAPKVLGPAWTGGGATFNMGALGALSNSHSELLPPVVDLDATNRALLLDAWREWVRDVDAAQQTRTAEGTRRILQALEDVMLRGPDPAANRTAYEVVGLLATALTWRDGDASRDRLVRWFDAPGISASDLHALTAALANSSAASSIDLSMVLSPTADPGQRSILRDRFAAVWSLSAAGARTTQVQELLSRARGALSMPATTPAARLANAAFMAHLNSAAAYAWAGEPYPRPLLAGPSTVSAPVPTPMASTPGSTVTFTGPSSGPTSTPESTWGVQYLAAGPNIPARRELLQRVVGPLSRLDASVLATEALRGSPQQLRNDAIAVARKFLGDAAMIEALLDLAPGIPATIDNTEFLEAASGVALPSPRDATWRLEVRRALVARLLELLGGKSLKEVDELSAQFADAYEAAVNQANPTKPDANAVVPDTPPAGVSAIALRTLWQRRAEAVLPSGREPMTLAQINAARPSRLRLARTPIQTVSVEQANIAELMAFIIVAERPDTASDATTILADMVQERARADHIFQQLEAGERAILRLWMLRFGESTIPEAPAP